MTTNMKGYTGVVTYPMDEPKSKSERKLHVWVVNNQIYLTRETARKHARLFKGTIQKRFLA